MKNLFIIFIIFSISFNNSIAQSPTIQWQNTIGGSGEDKLFSIQQTIDGGYILGGWSESGVTGDKTEASQGSFDYWIVKINNAGNISWQNTIGGNNTEVLNSIQQTEDDGFIIGGYSKSEISGDKTEPSQGGYDYWIVKLDSTGQTIEWQNTIGGSDRDDLITIQQTIDGGYILGGESSSGITGDKIEPNQGSGDDYWIVKLDVTGQTIEWQNTIGGSNTDRFTSIQQTTDGGYILGGYSKSEISGDKTEPSQGGYDYWIVKLDSTGQTIEWQNTMGGSENDKLQSIQQTNDGGYILGGYSPSEISGDKTEGNLGDWDYWVVKLDITGQEIEWQNTIGGSKNDVLYDIKQTDDGEYIIIGYSESGITEDKTEESRGNDDYWIMKLNVNGVIKWEKTIGGDNLDFPETIQQTTDGKYILGGYSDSGITGDKTEESQGTFDYWVVKFDDTTLSVVDNNNYKPIPSEFTILPAYPNPFNPSTTITYGLDKDSEVIINIYDISGKLITTLLNTEQKQGWNSVEWNGIDYNNNQVPAGIYLSKITSNEQTNSVKLMLLK